MALAITVLNNNGDLSLVLNGLDGFPVGQIGDVRARLREIRDMPIERRDVLRAVWKRLRDSGLDPSTATLNQMKTAIEGSEIDV